MLQLKGTILENKNSYCQKIDNALNNHALIQHDFKQLIPMVTQGLDFSYVFILIIIRVQRGNQALNFRN